MLNQIVIVGRLIGEVELKEEGEKKVAGITLAVPRSFKNEEGGYETDYIPCVLWDGVAENTKEYCHKGDIIGVKGRVESIEMASGYSIQIIAERITFLNNSKEEK